MIIDTHTHLFMNKEKSEEDIIQELEADQISHIISVGIDIETSRKSIELAKKYPWKVFAAVGIHPSDVFQYQDSFQASINQLESLIVHHLPYIKAIGECGFDTFRISESDRPEALRLQKEFFVAQINLAKKYSLPIIIHSRESKEETIEILKDTGMKNFILHCYSEDLDYAYKALYYSELCKISFSGIVTYKSAINVQKTAANIPLNRILVETDCPFLAPQPVRGQECVPNYTRHNLEKIFMLRKENGKWETWEEFVAQVYKNSLEMFRIG